MENDMLMLSAAYEAVLHDFHCQVAPISEVALKKCN